MTAIPAGEESLSPLAELLAAAQTLRVHPSLALTRPELAPPLVDWLERRATYASAYDRPDHQEVAATAPAVTFAREVNALAGQQADPIAVANAAQEEL